MKRIAIWLAAAILLLSSEGVAQTTGTGLIFMDPGRYQGIPPADMPFSGGSLPATYDMSADMPPPGFQGKQNSCVAWSVAYALRSYQARKTHNWLLVAANGDADEAHVFSPAYVYHQLNHGMNSGIPIVEALNLIAQQGVSTLSTMHYSELDISSPPPPAATAEAPNYKILTWRRVNATNVVEIKAFLAANYPIVIGALVDQSFVSLPSDQVWSANGGTQTFAHAMVVVGYDDTRHAFKVINSWGRTWSDGGYGWISYDQFTQVVREAFQVLDSSSLVGNTQPQPLPVSQPNQPIFSPNPVTPTPPQGQLQIVGVLHNQQVLPGITGMQIAGTITVPAGLSGTVRIVIRIRTPMGLAVGSLDPRFATPLGEAATGTPPLPLNGAALVNQPWVAVIPYCALNVPKGIACMMAPNPFAPPIRTDLFADTTLFINDFGVAKGPTIPFAVNL